MYAVTSREPFSLTARHPPPSRTRTTPVADPPRGKLRSTR